MTRSPTLLGRLIALVFGLILMIAVCEVALRMLMPGWHEFYSSRFMQVTETEDHGRFAIGRPGFDGWFAQNNGDFRVHLQINDFGLRNPEPVEAADAAVWVIGDSMSFGWGVERDEMYSERIEKALSVPVYNVASPGSDVCGYRALAGRMPDEAQPRAVVVGLVLENDVADYDCEAKWAATTAVEEADDQPVQLITLKNWLIGHSALYNFLAVNLKRVDVVRETLIAVGLVAPDHAYKRFFNEDRLPAVTAGTADELAALRDQFADGTPFAVLVMPARFELSQDDAVYRRLRLDLSQALTERGIGIIDPYEGFREAGFAPTHFAHDGHWSPLGHRVAADAVAAWLDDALRTPGPTTERQKGDSSQP